MNTGLSEFMKEENGRKRLTHPSKLGRYPPCPYRGSVTAMRKLNIDWRAVIDDDEAKKIPGKSVPVSSLPGNNVSHESKERKGKGKFGKKRTRS